MNDPIKRKKLYDSLKETGEVTVSFEDFTSGYSSIEKQQKLYDVLKSDGRVTVDFDTFSSGYFGDLLPKKQSAEAGTESLSVSANGNSLSGSKENVTEITPKPTESNYLGDSGLSEKPKIDVPGFAMPEKKTETPYQSEKVAPRLNLQKDGDGFTTGTEALPETSGKDFQPLIDNRFTHDVGDSYNVDSGGISLKASDVSKSDVENINRKINSPNGIESYNIAFKDGESVFEDKDAFAYELSAYGGNTEIDKTTLDYNRNWLAQKAKENLASSLTSSERKSDWISRNSKVNLFTGQAELNQSIPSNDPEPMGVNGKDNVLGIGVRVLQEFHGDKLNGIDLNNLSYYLRLSGKEKEFQEKGVIGQGDAVNTEENAVELLKGYTQWKNDSELHDAAILKSRADILSYKIESGEYANEQDYNQDVELYNLTVGNINAHLTNIQSNEVQLAENIIPVFENYVKQQTEKKQDTSDYWEMKRKFDSGKWESSDVVSAVGFTASNVYNNVKDVVYNYIAGGSQLLYDNLKYVSIPYNLMNDEDKAQSDKAVEEFTDYIINGQEEMFDTITKDIEMFAPVEYYEYNGKNITLKDGLFFDESGRQISVASPENLIKTGEDEEFDSLAILPDAATQITLMGLTVMSGNYSPYLAYNFKETKQQYLDAFPDANEFEATQYALFTNGVEALTERISPDKKLLGINAGNKLIDVLKGVSKESRWQATKSAGKEFLYNFFAEQGEELSVIPLQKGINLLSNLYNGDKKLQQEIESGELSETILATAVTFPFMGAGGTIAKYREGRSSLTENDLLLSAVRNEGAYTKINEWVRDAENNPDVSKESLNEFKAKLNDVIQYKDKIPSNYNFDEFNKAKGFIQEKELLEQKKKELDPAFHEEINQRIAAVDEKIKNIKPKPEQSKSENKSGNLLTNRIIKGSEGVEGISKEAENVSSSEPSIKETKPTVGIQLSKKTQSVIKKSIENDVTIEDVLEKESDKLEFYKSTYGESDARTVEQESIVNELAAYKDGSIDSSVNNLELKLVNGKPEVTHKRGNKVSEKQKRKAVRESVQTGLYDGIPRALDNAPMLSSDEEVSSYIADNSENPLEVAEEIKNIQSRDNSNEVGFEDVLLPHIRGGVKEESFVGNSDKNNVTPKIRGSYFNKNGKSLDVIAQEVEVEMYGDYNANAPRITEQDIVDFILENPSVVDYENAKKSNEQIALETKFTELTGLPATKQNIDAFVPKSETKKDDVAKVDEVEKSEETTKDETPEEDFPFSVSADTKPFESDSKEGVSVAKLKAKYPDAFVVQSESDLPEPIQDGIRQHKAEGKIKGVFFRGRVFMVADNIKTMGQARGTYRHERLGHQGVIEHLGDKLAEFSNSIIDNAKGGRKKKLIELAERYGMPTDLSILTPAQKKELGEEYIAQISENSDRYPQAWNEIVMFVRKALKDFGINMQVSDAEIRALIGKVEANVKQKAKNLSQAQKDARFQVDDSKLESERKQIISKSKADGTFLLAPNGKPTNLSEEQWITVRTKNFKNWFGDWENNPSEASKVVDENGEPMVVYHGSQNVDIIKEFKNPRSLGNAYWFSPNKDFVKYDFNENMLNTFLNVKKILDFKLNPDLVYDYTTWVRSKYGMRESLDRMSYIESTGLPSFNDEYIYEFAKENNFDGILLQERVKQMYGSDEISYAVFNSNQIKSATDNVGTFSEDNNDIRFQIDDFRDAHTAPSMEWDTVEEALEEGGSVNLSELSRGLHNVPQEFFSNEQYANRMFSYSGAKESLSAIFKVKRKIEEGKNPQDVFVKAYRSIPTSVNTNTLIKDDWITFSKEYATDHGENRFGEGEYKIIEQEVPITHVWWDGNDINEWGYDPSNELRFQVDAYHGSPHSFDRFTTEKMGTGEGAQAFGWGLYFTDLKSIAEGYANRLTSSIYTINGEEINASEMSDDYRNAVDDIIFYGFDVALDRAKQLNQENIVREIEKLNGFSVSSKKADRNLYKVSLHKGKQPSEYTWLEWDKELSKEKIIEIFNALGKEQDNEQVNIDYEIENFLRFNDRSGQGIYKYLSNQLGSDKQASLFLLEAGIDGIKYPAESISRGATSDNARGFNYVVFDENAVTIEEAIRFQKSNSKTPKKSISEVLRDRFFKARDLTQSIKEKENLNKNVKRKAEAIWKKTNRGFNVMFRSGGGLPKEFSEIVKQLGRDQSAVLDRLSYESRQLKRVIAKATKGKTDAQFNEIGRWVNAYMAGEDVDLSFMGQDALDQLDYFRSRIDSVSNKIIDVLNKKMGYWDSQLLSINKNDDLSSVIDEIISNTRKAPETKQSEIITALIDAGHSNTSAISHASKIIAREKTAGLIKTIEDNKGRYINRSYEAFHNPKYLEDLSTPYKKMRPHIQKRFDRAVNYLVNNEGYTKENAIIEVNKYIADLVKSEDVGDFIMSSTGRANAPFLKQRKELPLAFRELLGEVKDPTHNYIRTVFGMSEYLAKLDYQERMRDALIKANIGSYQAKDSNYELFAGTSPEWSILHGLYVPKEFKEAMDDMADLDPVKGDITKLYIQLTGWTKVGKTVWSPTTVFRNLYSGIALGINAGHFFGTHPKHTIEAFNQAFGTNKSVNTEQAKAFREKLVSLGVIGDGVNSGELRATLNDFRKPLEEMVRPSRLGRVINFMNTAYAFGDDFYKVVGFLTERDRLIKSGMDTNLAEIKAAERIRGGYPTYSYLPKGMKALRRFPLMATFVSFPYEAVRTTKNNMIYAYEDFRDGRTSMGMKRVAGLLAANVLNGGAVTLINSLLDWDDEDEKVVRKMLPEYQKNANLLFVRGKDGDPMFIDMTSLFPSEVWMKPLATLMGGRSDHETFMSQLGDASNELVAPYLSFDITTKTMLEIMINKEINANTIFDLADFNNITGRDIRAHDKNSWENGWAIVNHYLKKSGPGVYNNISEVLRSNNKLSSMVGEKETPEGREYTNGDAVLAFFGIRATTLNHRTTLNYYGFKLTTGLVDIGSNARKEADKTTLRSDKSVNSTVEEMASEYKKLSKEARETIEVSRKLGLKDSEIFTILTGSSSVSKTDAKILLMGGDLFIKPIGDKTIERELLIRQELPSDKERGKKHQEIYLKNASKINSKIGEMNKVIAERNAKLFNASKQ